MNNQADQANRYAPPQAEVADSGDDDAGQLASRLSRFGAVLLDGVVGALFVYLPFVVLSGGAFMSAITKAASESAGDPKKAQKEMIGTLLNILTGPGGKAALVGMVILMGLTIYYVHRNGQTIGKKLLGIKVVRTDGSRAGLGRIFWMRNVVNMLPAIIPFVGGLYGLADPLFIFSDSRRCLHDRIADTIVIKAKSA